ncbi:MAG: DNA primase noncatalytic subunit PriX [Thermoproteus sp.]|nr:DNA primase noncatalytic subunit PriX [Thermoproteus sp.]
MSYLDFWERFIFGGTPRAFLYVCNDKSAQIYVEGIHEVMDYMIASLLGKCDVRRSVNPRARDINTVPSITAVAIDIDNPESPDLTFFEALKVKQFVEQIGGDALIVRTGGKGHYVYIPIDPPIVDEEHILEKIYKSLLNDIVNSTKIKHADMAVNYKSHVRIPFTRHKETGNVVYIISDDGSPVEDPRDALSIYESMKGINASQYVEAILQTETAKFKVATSAPRAKRMAWIDALIDACMPDCRKRFILYVLSRYLVNVLGLGLEESTEKIVEWYNSCSNKFNVGGKIYKSWVTSVVRAVKDKKLMPIGEAKWRELCESAKNESAKTV